MEIANSKTISKLKDDNGYKWSYDMKMILGSKDLRKNCEFRSIEEYLVSLDGDMKGKNEKKEISISERREWKKDDAKCLSIISNKRNKVIPILRSFVKFSGHFCGSLNIKIRE